jgi:hypothetical protein
MELKDAVMSRTARQHNLLDVQCTTAHPGTRAKSGGDVSNIYNCRFHLGD